MIPLGSLVYPRQGGMVMVVVDTSPGRIIGAWFDGRQKIVREAEYDPRALKVAKLPSDNQRLSTPRTY